MKQTLFAALVAISLVLAPVAMPDTGDASLATSEIGAYLGGKSGAGAAAVGGIIGGAVGLFGGAYLGSIIAPGPGTVFAGLKGADIGAGLGAIVGGA
ncbi:MAG: hypothetical protein F4Y16_08855 [Holophagales bacterium]|nr:hypothetical protein [Holophagales bacterium]MYH25186.1 hypothetical protein [Holophagales bacterium]